MIGTGEVSIEGNNNDDESAMVGENDAIPSASGDDDCDLSEASEGGTFYSIGGDGGFVVASFATVLVPGDSIRVWEISQDTCFNVSSVRPDSYDVFVGTADALAQTSDASDLQEEQGWIRVGSSAPNGGLFLGVVPEPEG